MVPLWTDVLEIAAAWGMPPWEVEDAPLIWIDRFREWTLAKNEQQTYATEKAGGGGRGAQVGNRHTKRFV